MSVQNKATFGTTTETEMLVSRPSLRSTETENCKSHPGTVIIRLEARDADDGINGEVRYGFARCDFLLVVLSDLGVECSSVVCSFCAMVAAVPSRPQDGTVSVIVLFTIVSSCVTDCNF